MTAMDKQGSTRTLSPPTVGREVRALSYKSSFKHKHLTSSFFPSLINRQFLVSSIATRTRDDGGGGDKGASEANVNNARKTMDGWMDGLLAWAGNGDDDEGGNR